MWVKYNPNPSGRNVEDCAVRAISKALDTDWEHAFAMLVSNAYQMNDMPHADSVWGSVLRQHGFYRASIPNRCPNCYTAEDFSRDHPKGIFVLSLNHHVATQVDGNHFDSWDSTMESPQYFWYKKED